MTVTKGKLVVAGGEGRGRGGKQYLDDMEIFTGTRWILTSLLLLLLFQVGDQQTEAGKAKVWILPPQDP